MSTVSTTHLVRWRSPWEDDSVKYTAKRTPIYRENIGTSHFNKILNEYKYEHKNVTRAVHKIVPTAELCESPSRERWCRKANCHLANWANWSEQMSAGLLGFCATRRGTMRTSLGHPSRYIGYPAYLRHTSRINSSPSQCAT